MGAAVINFCTEIVAIDDSPFVPIRLNLYEIVCDKREIPPIRKSLEKSERPK